MDEWGSLITWQLCFADWRQLKTCWKCKWNGILLNRRWEASARKGWAGAEGGGGWCWWRGGHHPPLYWWSQCCSRKLLCVRHGVPAFPQAFTFWVCLISPGFLAHKCIVLNAECLICPFLSTQVTCIVLEAQLIHWLAHGLYCHEDAVHRLLWKWESKLWADVGGWFAGMCGRDCITRSWQRSDDAELHYG